MLKLRIFTSGDVSLNVSESLVNAITEFFKFVEVCDEGVDFFVDVARLVDLLVNCAIRINNGDGR